MKGLRVFGKNFFKIRKEFLPEKDTVSVWRSRQNPAYFVSLNLMPNG